MENAYSIVAFNKAQAIFNDLQTAKLSEAGKDALISCLATCMLDHANELKQMMKAISALSTRCSMLEAKTTVPAKLEAEFKSISKAFNFPSTQAVLDGDVSQPNLNTMPFEESLPKTDLEFILSRLDDNPEDKTGLEKDEQLPNDEVKMHKSVGNAVDMCQSSSKKAKKTRKAKKPSSKENAAEKTLER